MAIKDTNKRLTTAETSIKTEGIKTTAKGEPKSSWDIKKSIRLPKLRNGAQEFVTASVNGRDFQVPRGKVVDVPLPIYEVLVRTLEAEDNEDDFINRADNKGEEKLG